MAKRDKDTITIGSATLYIMPFADAMPTQDELFRAENRAGWTKGGASVEYTEEATEEKDDLGMVSKVITTEEEAIIKCGLLTWNGNTLQTLVDRCTVVEAQGKRTVKIGGAGNAQGKYYAIGLHHVDKTDGDIWVIIKGRNNVGLTLTLAKDEGTVLEPEFKAMPHDEAGTLIEYVEEIPTV